MSVPGELEFPVPRPEIVCARFAQRIDPRSRVVRSGATIAIAIVVVAAIASVWIPAVVAFVLAQLVAWPLFLLWRRRYLAALHDLIRDGQLHDMVIVQRGMLRTAQGGATYRCRGFEGKPGTQLRVLCKPSLSAMIAFDDEQRLYRGSMHWR